MTNKLSRLGPLAAALLALGASAARAQSYCASDGVTAPAALVERFINADCEACWRDSGSLQPRRGDLAVDWVVPGGRGVFLMHRLVDEIEYSSPGNKVRLTKRRD